MSLIPSPPFTPDSKFAPLETPHVSTEPISITALARFEFEAGKGNDGTKVLMVEWEDSDFGRPSTSLPGGSWHVAWEGKQAVLPADEQASENTRRLYFLLPPHVTIPPVVTLSYEAPLTTPSSSTTVTPSQMLRSLQLNPLPAIFPPELCATGSSAGKKGVLHTRWAKKRLQVLDKDIREEFLTNAEGIALHIALQEKDWIETNFGLGPRSDSQAQSVRDFNYPMGPTTPISPSSGGKLSEKLKGLKLQTSERKLSFGVDAPSNPANHPLSPQSPDVAISSFNSFHSTLPSNSNPVRTPDTVKTVPQYPPESIQVQQDATSHDIGFAPIGKIVHTSSADSGEELFAKALSPRSPDLPRSPFSFASETLHT